MVKNVQRLSRCWHRLVCGCHNEGEENLFSGWVRVFLPLLQAAAIAWFLLRVIPKPMRAAYPCQQAAFPIASSIVLTLVG